VRLPEPPADPVRELRRVAGLHHAQDLPGLPAEARMVGQVGNRRMTLPFEGRLGYRADAVEELEVGQDTAPDRVGVDGPQAPSVAAHEAPADPTPRADLLAGQDLFQFPAPVAAEKLALKPPGLVELAGFDPGGAEGPCHGGWLPPGNDDAARPLEALAEPAADAAAHPLALVALIHDGFLCQKSHPPRLVSRRLLCVLPRAPASKSRRRPTVRERRRGLRQRGRGA